MEVIILLIVCFIAVISNIIQENYSGPRLISKRGEIFLYKKNNKKNKS